MRISRRLYKIAELVSDGASAADIGTDHGYVPMLLIKEGKCPRVIMSDISEGSLAKAKETFRLCGLSDMVSDSDFRVGDGLETIEAAEADEVIIAGLGGHTIADILAADEDKARSFKRIILQPRKHSGSLRYWLHTHGWIIESENLAPEGKFACEIITALPCGQEACTDVPDCPPADDIRWKYPAAMAEADYELAKKRIEWKTGSITEQIDNLKKASSDGNSREGLISKLEADRAYLLNILPPAGQALSCRASSNEPLIFALNRL